MADLPAAMAVPADRSQLAALLQFSQECAVPYWIIGNGSNMLVSDQGLDGIAILLDSSFEGEIVQEGNLLIAPAESIFQRSVPQLVRRA